MKPKWSPFFTCFSLISSNKWCHGGSQEYLRGCDFLLFLSNSFDWREHRTLCNISFSYIQNTLSYKDTTEGRSLTASPHFHRISLKAPTQPTTALIQGPQSLGFEPETSSWQVIQLATRPQPDGLLCSCGCPKCLLDKPITFGVLVIRLISQSLYVHISGGVI